MGGDEKSKRRTDQTAKSIQAQNHSLRIEVKYTQPWCHIGGGYCCGLKLKFPQVLEEARKNDYSLKFKDYSP